MFKKNISVILLVLISLFSGGSKASSLSHVDQLKQKYPYMLLSDEYGILNEDDMAMNTCVANSAPFSEDNISSFYFRCFRAKDVTAKCEKGEYDPIERILRSDGSITAHEGKETYLYYFRQRIGFKMCRDEISEMKALLKGQEYVCISGQFSGYGNPDLPNNDDHHFLNWVYDKLKTSKGCTSYFGGECDVKYWQEDGCEPIVQKYGKFMAKGHKAKNQL